MSFVRSLARGVRALNILVTGGAGYIGSHTADAIQKSGHMPIVYDNLSAGHRWAVGSKPLVEADLSDKLSIQRAIKQHNIEAVIHFAAYAYVGESVTDPRKYFQNNVVNTLNLLDVMLDLGVKYIVLIAGGISRWGLLAGQPRCWARRHNPSPNRCKASKCMGTCSSISRYSGSANSNRPCL